MVAMLLQFQRLSINGSPFARRPRRRNIVARPVMSVKTQSAPSRTQRIMEKISLTAEVGGAGGAYSYDALKRLDHLWSSICSNQTVAQEPHQVVFSVPSSFNNNEFTDKVVETFDVLVCGGTLGIFIATSLCAKGLRVGIVERNVLKGREQEWNISRKELLELVKVGILTEEEIEQVTSANFNPNRCGFEGKGEIWVENILNLGISPVKLIETMKKRFSFLGGVIFEGCSVSSISTYEDAAVLQLSEGKILSSHLVVDAMGNFSPIVKQTRRGKKPDGVCLVVGSCARGFDKNCTSDIIYSSSSVNTISQSEVQLFWEAFPAGSGPTDRTTYMFTYLDPQPRSPSLEDLLEHYWDLMPAYQGAEMSNSIPGSMVFCSSQVPTLHKSFSNQIKAGICSALKGVSLDDLEIMRVVYGIFPTYRDSPLPAAFDRILQFGDASGIQSPVSFGGFGSLTRHLERLSAGIYEAIEGNFLDSSDLSLLNPYMPNLSSSWLFQRAMSAKQDSNVSPNFINELLHANFQSMEKLGDPVLRPFLQDVIQFGPLVKTLGLVMLTNPQIIPSIFKQVGFPVLFDWFGHFLMLGYYTTLSIFLDPLLRPLLKSLPPRMKYRWHRYLDAWKYGAGLDYEV